MSFSESTHAGQHGDIPLIRWAIRGRTTRTLLSSGHNGPVPPVNTAHFGGPVPLLFTDRRSARGMWIKWLEAHKFIERRMSLPKQAVAYDVLEPLPEVDLVTVRIKETAIVPFILNSGDDDNG